jgi:hypothetical protein
MNNVERNLQLCDSLTFVFDEVSKNSLSKRQITNFLIQRLRKLDVAKSRTWKGRLLLQKSESYTTCVYNLNTQKVEFDFPSYNDEDGQWFFQLRNGNFIVEQGEILYEVSGKNGAVIKELFAMSPNTVLELRNGKLLAGNKVRSILYDGEIQKYNRSVFRALQLKDGRIVTSAYNSFVDLYDESYNHLKSIPWGHFGNAVEYTPGVLVHFSVRKAMHTLNLETGKAEQFDITTNDVKRYLVLENGTIALLDSTNWVLVKDGKIVHTEPGATESFSGYEVINKCAEIAPNVVAYPQDEKYLSVFDTVNLEHKKIKLPEGYEVDNFVFE